MIQQRQSGPKSSHKSTVQNYTLSTKMLKHCVKCKESHIAMRCTLTVFTGKQTKARTLNMEDNTGKEQTGNISPQLEKLNQFNSHCPQRLHCPPLSSSFWPYWDSSGKPDCHSAHCSSYGQPASMCSFCLYPGRRRKDLRKSDTKQTFRVIKCDEKI